MDGLRSAPLGRIPPATAATPVLPLTSHGVPIKDLIDTADHLSYGLPAWTEVFKYP
jgi:hypothetical protein